MSDTLKAFFDCWGEGDAEARKRHLERILEPHFTYADPHAPETIRGIKAMADFLDMFTRRMPESSARLVHVDSHGGFHRATVDFMRDADHRMTRGQYFLETDADNRLVRAVGFAGDGLPDEGAA